MVQGFDFGEDGNNQLIVIELLIKTIAVTRQDKSTIGTPYGCRCHARPWGALHHARKASAIAITTARRPHAPRPRLSRQDIAISQLVGPVRAHLRSRREKSHTPNSNPLVCDKGKLWDDFVRTFDGDSQRISHRSFAASIRSVLGGSPNARRNGFWGAAFLGATLGYS